MENEKSPFIENNVDLQKPARRRSSTAEIIDRNYPSPSTFELETSTRKRRCGRGEGGEESLILNPLSTYTLTLQIWVIVKAWFLVLWLLFLEMYKRWSLHKKTLGYESVELSYESKILDKLGGVAQAIWKSHTRRWFHQDWFPTSLSGGYFLGLISGFFFWWLFSTRCFEESKKLVR